MPVWGPNWKSLQAFLACTTIWRRAIGPAGQIWLGLGYADMETVLNRFAGIVRGSARQRTLAKRRRDALFDDLQVMEGAALKAFAEADA